VSGAVLLTGATGFLGMDLLATLVEQGREVIVPVRASDAEHAKVRLDETIARLYEEPPVAAEVRALPADLRAPGLGISDADREMLASEVDSIVHCAASISFGIELADARAINVSGVAEMLALAREIASKGSLRRLVHVSTAYVCGRHDGVFAEGDLELGQEFRNAYERSKHEAETLVREAGDLPAVIARPSIVVGHSESGWTSAFNVIYGPMRAFERGMLSEVPASSDSIIDFVPVDYVTAGLLHLLDDPDVDGTYHLVAGDQALTAGELAAAQAELLGRPPMKLLPPGSGSRLPAGIETYAPYLDIRCRFDDRRARAAFAPAGFAPPPPGDYLGRLVEYARRARWGKLQVSRQASFAGALG